MRSIAIILSMAFILLGCSATKKAQRKARRADRLLKEAGMLAPSIMDTVWITKVDTLVLTVDSIVTVVEVRQDPTKVDSLIALYNKLKAQGASPEVIEKVVYRELVPDLSHQQIDSLSIEVDGKNEYLRFSIKAEMTDAELTITTKALDDISYVTEKAEVTVDAVRKRFWQDWLFWLIVAGLTVLAFFFVVRPRYIR